MHNGTQPGSTRQMGWLREYLYFLRHHPAWYLVPIAAVLAAAAWAAMSHTPKDPAFRYPIF